MGDGAVYLGYYNTSPECWGLYTEVLGAEYSNDLLFGQVQKLTVDSYAVQHAGGQHPDKSIAIHLCGLYLVLHRGLRPTRVPPLLQRLSDTVQVFRRGGFRRTSCQVGARDREDRGFERR